ncbi:MAG: single-stranded-DNA-specific exonuclease RecJ [Desulfosarcina sp.]|jgi:single-stranded-DNA-specific exonuclease
MEKQWQLLNPNPQTVRKLTRQMGCSPLTARLLVIRGIQSESQASRFLRPSLNHLTPPMEMAGMQAAVDRIQRALMTDETIMVCGDYDADGITATALLVAFLRQCGATVDYYIPHRIIDGYGLQADVISKRVLPAGVKLIVTADCGTGSQDAITSAYQAGIDTIVTDHHPVDRLPERAVSVINPARSDCKANLNHLAGVGVAFYLIIALRTQLRQSGFWNKRKEPNLKQLCDLVALGTIADVSPLIEENRDLTVAGLQQINQYPRPGLLALMHMSGLSGAPVDAETIAFKLAPRLNAAGRLVHARMACELLLTTHNQKARRLAGALCRLNHRRQLMETELLQSIQERLAAVPDELRRPVLFVHGNGWHEGILGIVASRLTRQYHRPAVVISSRNGMAKGSARSIEGIDMAKALTTCADQLDSFGGHPLAAGLSLSARRIDAFRSRLEAAVEGLTAEHGAKPPTVSIDAQLPLGHVNPALMERLERLGPFGQHNPHPLFMDTGLRIIDSKTVGGRHRRMILATGTGGNANHPAIQFNVGNRPLAKKRFEKIAYRPQWNYWKGRKQLQLLIEDTDPDS